MIFLLENDGQTWDIKMEFELVAANNRFFLTIMFALEYFWSVLTGKNYFVKVAETEFYKITPCILLDVKRIHV